MAGRAVKRGCAQIWTFGDYNGVIFEIIRKIMEILYWGYSRKNGKDNGNYYIGVILGIMEKNRETTILGLY